MPLVCLTSPKGGVGRTTLAAAIGVALHRLGRRVLLLDLDRQNALRLNFELPEDLAGIGSDIEGSRAWSDFAVETPTGVSLIPFGGIAPLRALDLYERVTADPGWARERLEPLLGYSDLTIVADLPAAPSPLSGVVDAVADLHLLALLPDAMSLALLPRLQRGEYLVGVAPGAVRLGYIVNQIDARRQLCRDVLALSRDVVGERLYGTVHLDEAVAEAAACQMTVLDYAPESGATQDIVAIARRVHAELA